MVKTVIDCGGRAGMTTGNAKPFCLFDLAK